MGLILHPNKEYLQECQKRVSFVGARIFPYYRLPSERLMRNFKCASGRYYESEMGVGGEKVDGGKMARKTGEAKKKIRVLVKNKEKGCFLLIKETEMKREEIANSYISYLGHLRHLKHYNLVRECNQKWGH